VTPNSSTKFKWYFLEKLNFHVLTDWSLQPSITRQWIRLTRFIISLFTLSWDMHFANCSICNTWAFLGPPMYVRMCCSSFHWQWKLLTCDSAVQLPPGCIMLLPLLSILSGFKLLLLFIACRPLPKRSIKATSHSACNWLLGHAFRFQNTLTSSWERQSKDKKIKINGVCWCGPRNRCTTLWLYWQQERKHDFIHLCSFQVLLEPVLLQRHPQGRLNYIPNLKEITPMISGKSVPKVLFQFLFFCTKCLKWAATLHT